jgi:hypothetical protein
MRNKHWIFALFVSWMACCPLATAQDIGLPASFDRDADIMSPGAFWGFEIGEYHPRHDQIVAYFEYLAETSDRVSLEVSGYSHDRRPVVMAIFAHPDRDVPQIKANRRNASRAGTGPLVAWMGYSVHGNEASAASAAVQTAYYLAASEDAEVSRWLDEMVIVMEPVLNPDGLDRFAHWVNMHRGQHPSSDPNDREHNEVWPNGRTNYYWFDLNRDWMPQVHPESRARMAQYYAWQPHLVTDFHEMGRNSTYFFQPGVPGRNNPLTPPEVFELTTEIATYHAKAMDEASQPYYTKESFDDYYVGKGSTYPDITGGIGILFEQGSARGHIQDTDFGKRTFADAISNQVITSLSSLRAASANSAELIDYQQRFFASAKDLAVDDRQAGWVLGDGNDPAKANILIDRLLHHQIEIYPATEAVRIDGDDYSIGSAWVIPANQDQYRLLQSLFEPITELSMETFYDVSTWPLGLSYDLPISKVRRLPSYGSRLTEAPTFVGSDIDQEAIAWVIPWDQYQASAVLAGLMAQGYRVQATTNPMMVGDNDLVRGSLVIHRGNQPKHLTSVASILSELVKDHPVVVMSLNSGLAQNGPDIGSPSIPVLPAVRAAMLVGEGVNVYNAGYIWYWFDQYLKQPIAKIDTSQVRQVDWSNYTHVILPEGAYARLGSSFSQGIKDFVRGGGIVIANRSAAKWIESVDLDWDWAKEANDDDKDSDRRPYEDHSLDFAREVIGGSALSINLDITHPLGFGYTDSELTVFRRGAHVLKTDTNHYTRAGIYEDPVLKSGYLGEGNQAILPNTPALVATRHGRGAVVRMADDYLFRGYWLGTERVFANAVFFSPLIGTTRLPSE